MNTLIDYVSSIFPFIAPWASPSSSEVPAPATHELTGALQRSGSSSSSSHSNSHVQVTVKPKKLDKYGKAFRELKRDVKKSDYTRLTVLLNQFATENSQCPYLKESPQVCAKLVPLMVDELNKGSLTGELVRKVIKQFCRSDVFKKMPRKDNLEIRGRDGAVLFNKTLLTLQNDYFKTMFSSSMATAQKGADGKYHVDLSQNASGRALVHLKSYFHEQVLPKADIYTPISAGLLLELLDLSRMIGEDTLLKAVKEQMRQKITHTICRDESVFKEMFELVNHLEGQDENTEELRLGVVQSYLTANQISHRKTGDGKHILLSGSSAAILERDDQVSKLLQKYVKGFIVSNRSDFDKVLLLMFLSSKFKESIKEIVLEGVTFLLEFSEIAKIFPNIENMTVQSDGLASYVPYDYCQSTEAVVLNDISFLVKAQHFKKLTSIRLLLANKPVDYMWDKMVIVNLSKNTVDALKNTPKIIFDFKQTALRLCTPPQEKGGCSTDYFEEHVKASTWFTNNYTWLGVEDRREFQYKLNTRTLIQIKPVLI